VYIDLPNQDAYILKLWYLVYSQIWTNLQMFVTNGYITKLQKEKHCSILYANQVFFFFKLWYGEFGKFSPNYLAKLFELTLERQISPKFSGFASFLFSRGKKRPLSLNLPIVNFFFPLNWWNPTSHIKTQAPKRGGVSGQEVTWISSMWTLFRFRV